MNIYDSPAYFPNVVCLTLLLQHVARQLSVSLVVGVDVQIALILFPVIIVIIMKQRYTHINAQFQDK